MEAKGREGLHHGFSDEDSWEIVGIASFFAPSNRMAIFLSMRPNGEFFAIGRGGGKRQ